MRISLILTAAASLTLLRPALADDTTNRFDKEAALQYQHCIATARNSPAEGWQEALAWSSLDGGEPAHHCAAVALIGMRQFEEGATRLETLAHESHESPRLRAGMLAQAGQAWLLAKQPDNAYKAQTKALDLVPGAPDLLVDRAQSLAEMKNYAGALQDLDAALDAKGDRVDALIFRATARRYLNDMDGARADIAKALALDDHAQDAWLEDGIERAGLNDLAGARDSWNKVLTLAPQSDAAETAKRDLDVLDATKP